MFGWAALAFLDLLDRHYGTADQPGEVVLRQIERLAALPEPMRESAFTFHRLLQPSGAGSLYEFLYELAYDKSPSMSNDALV